MFMVRDSDPRFDFFNPRLTLWDDDDFDYVLLQDGRIVRASGPDAIGMTPTQTYGGSYIFEGGSSLRTNYPYYSSTGIYTITAVPVPEPGTYLLMVGGLALLLARRLRLLRTVA
jgi:hypothetical protein